MKLIIPMAGRGTRLRPHTHTTPKPLLPIAGKMMIERIIETFMRTIDKDIEEIAFVLGDFGSEVENKLKQMTERFGAKCSIYHQDVAMGTAHAVYCARASMQGEIIVAFADTLFDVKSNVEIEDADSIIWLKKVDNPSSFGVAVMDGDRITSFVEKPSEPVSDLAIIGVYYFREGEHLKKELINIVENDLKSPRGEYELTDAIDSLLDQKKVFKPATVDTWLDCGTLKAWIDTTNAVLNKNKNSAEIKSFPNVKIIPPVYIGNNVEITDSVIGPYVSIEDGTRISGSTLSDVIVNNDAVLTNCELDNSTVGSFNRLQGVKGQIHTGDHSQIHC